MLSLHRSVIAQNDVAAMQAFLAINLQSVANRHADGVRNERRHAACVLRNELPVWTRKANGKIVVLVDIGAERGALDVRVNLVADGN